MAFSHFWTCSLCFAERNVETEFTDAVRDRILRRMHRRTEANALPDGKKGTPCLQCSQKGGGYGEAIGELDRYATKNKYTVRYIEECQNSEGKWVCVVQLMDRGDSVDGEGSGDKKKDAKQKAAHNLLVKLEEMMNGMLIDE